VSDYRELELQYLCVSASIDVPPHLTATSYPYMRSDIFAVQ